MSKKLSDNGIWESSRMIISEHRERILDHYRELAEKEKPILYEDEREVIYARISESYEHKISITLVLFDRYEDTRVIGVIERIDAINKRVRVDGEWFFVNEVIAAE
ncbi:hypothetical protein BBD42_15535 [Paenibacillus sp. BIHB 4019]|uniref:YolD-like family protein n=1 Tax=Paenibacillus sp. BIHB 4019 TaxID=1870819 RepID=A0A1B2DJ49_9BACL|nr:YolD-like family protein [Paenibacillus sp. BIHB 4019]ANY67719.1 hypothetical protein BBD42_15535 [Paenibacillus sp. BIHB 4019]